MRRWEEKIIAVILVFLIPFACTLLPFKVSEYFIAKGKVGETFLGGLLCFGGGVFFGTYILHMAPESREILEQYLLADNDIAYPVAELIMACGFFLVLAIDQCVLSFVKYEAAHHKPMRKLSENAPDCKVCGYIVYGKRLTRRVSWPPENMATKISCGEANQWNRAFRCNCDNYFYPSHRPPRRRGRLSIRGYIDEDFTASAVKRQTKGSVRRLLDHSVSTKSISDQPTCCRSGEHYTALSTPISARQMRLVQSLANTSPDILPPQPEESVVLQDAHSRRAIILMFALSFHRIFEGIGLGLQTSSAYLWNLFVAIMCHETVIGFSLGLQFVKNKWSATRTAVTVFVMSLILPLGLIIGTLMVELEGTNPAMNIANGIIQCVATGTFVYVTFFEILGEEVLVHEMTSIKLLCAFLGFCSMALISLIPESDGQTEVSTAAKQSFNNSAINYD